LEKWKTMVPEAWGPNEVMAWVMELAQRRGDLHLQQIHVENFNDVTGMSLAAMTCDELRRRDVTFGAHIFSEFRNLLTQHSEY
jgi:hypothetical protein